MEPVPFGWVAAVVGALVTFIGGLIKWGLGERQTTDKVRMESDARQDKYIAGLAEKQKQVDDKSAAMVTAILAEREEAQKPLLAIIEKMTVTMNERAAFDKEVREQLSRINTTCERIDRRSSSNTPAVKP